MDMWRTPHPYSPKLLASKRGGKKREYYLVSALSNTVISGPKTRLVDSGASKHMTGYK